MDIELIETLIKGFKNANLTKLTFKCDDFELKLKASSSVFDSKDNKEDDDEKSDEKSDDTEKDDKKKDLSLEDEDRVYAL